MTRTRDQVIWDFVQSWLKKAEGDLKAAEAFLSIHTEDRFASAFHAQQAAEKYIKALLVWRQVPFSKTHEIQKLLKIFPDLDADLARDLSTSDWLTPYGVEFRYPGDENVDLATAKKAIEEAKKVEAAIKERLKDYLAKGRPRN